MPKSKVPEGKGRVYVASMNLRGKHAPKPPGIPRNVTSAQQKGSALRRDFSPMTPYPGKFRNFYNFEAWWQSLKRYTKDDKAVSPEEAKKIKEWWLKQTSAKRRCAIAHPKNGYKVSHAEDENGKQFDYKESRKKLYVPEYHAMIQNSESLAECKKAAAEGHDQVFVDFDGPRSEDGEPICEEVTIETLKKYINSTRFPFGHGWVVAAEVAGIDYKLYTE